MCADNPELKHTITIQNLKYKKKIKLASLDICLDNITFALFKT